MEVLSISGVSAIRKLGRTLYSSDQQNHQHLVSFSITFDFIFPKHFGNVQFFTERGKILF